ncbi:MAG: MOSC domain-containing protein [Flavobacteriaceae bacterium]|nr:MOSC domain-containing protein [Flavobacteriaceae bacterium]
MKVVSVNIGELTKVHWRKKTIETGIFKYPVNRPIFLDLENVRGDKIENRVHHGGIDQAVYAYGAQHYPYWKGLYPHQDWSYGMFGENLTITDFDETKIRVGSIYQLGEAKIEVTKPRQPCMKLGIRFNNQKIVKDFWNSTKSGVYFKILETGNVATGDELVLLENKPDHSTIAEVYTEKRIKKGK